MRNGQFEIHPVSTLGTAPIAFAQLRWQEGQSEPVLPPMAIRDDKLVGVRVDPLTGKLTLVSADEAQALFTLAPGRLFNSLVMVARSEGILVNGLPALPLSVLAPKDSLSLAAGCLCYVVERIKPYIGPATGEWLNKPCPFCRIPADANTRIVSCLCGAFYHWETAETHPEAPETDRLRCFEKVRACLSCGRALTTEEYATWEPANL